MSIRSFVLASLMAALFSVPLGTALTVDTWPASTSYTDLTSVFSDLAYHFEPSGVVWHEEDGVLYVVGNEGHLAAVNIDDPASPSGTFWSMSGNDVEGITYDAATPELLYIVDENTGTLKSWSMDTGSFVDSWALTDEAGNTLSEMGGWAGVEGLTYADGYFYAGWQYNGMIYKYELVGSEAVLVDTMGPFDGYASDISALSYFNGYLYVLFDAYDDLLIMTLDGEVMYQYTEVPGIEYEGDTSEQEGFTLLPSEDGVTTTAVIADDNGDLKMYGDFPVLTPDEDGDGVHFGEDCDDTDATVSEEESYYMDADGDTLGSTESILVCSSTAPEGYTDNANDTNDSIPNYGVEIKKDGVDNNDNGSIDETNIGFMHPYYSTLDPAAAYVGNVKNFWGLKNGYFAVKYWDFSVFKYRAFPVKSYGAVTTVTSVDGTAYLTVVLNDDVALVSAYTGEVLETTTLRSPTEEEVLEWALSVLAI